MIRHGYLTRRERGVVPELSHVAGKIICISSVHDIIPWAGHVNYATSKGGVSMMMKTMAQELAPQRIRVNAISPGAIKTPINTAAWMTPEAEAELLKLIPARPQGYGPNRELFPRFTGGTFDAISPAVAAADMTLTNLLDSERAARMVEQKALDPNLPTGFQYDPMGQPILQPAAGPAGPVRRG